jgi:threonyl-tRNA synthetase
MHVVLPDKSQLELPDGATGLDAARAIGPKLAEQSVLVRADGHAQDLRLPLADGQAIQILTTRDKDDPDALYVLRHSSAHLLAEAVRRLYPGVKVAIGPPIENGFYYDFEFPAPISDTDLERIEAEVQREIAEGRSWTREEISRDAARARFEAEGEPYKVELVDTAEGDITLYTQGDFVDLCRGPHLQTSAPIKAFRLTGLAGAYWRGDEKNTQLTRIYGTAFYSQADLDAHLERLEEARKRDHRRLGVQLDLFHLDEISPGSPFWHPKGMVIWNQLEDLRRRENHRRGYVEVKTPLIYDKSLWERSGHWEKFREEMFLIPEDERLFAIKPMNCPGHMVLFADTMRSYRELPLRYAEAAPLHRNERGGTLHGLTRVRHVTQDDAHLFCTREQIEEEIFGCLDYAKFIYDLFDLEANFELSTRPDNKLGTEEEWDFTEAALQAALDRRGLRDEDRPAHDRLDRALVADGDGPAGQPAARTSRLPVHRSRQRRAHPVRDPSRADGVARAVHRDPDRALRRRVPVLACPRPDPGPPGRRGPSRGGGRAGRETRAVPGRGRYGRRHRRQADPQRRGREDPVPDRLRRQGVRRLVGDPGARRRAIHPVACGISHIPC